MKINQRELIKLIHNNIFLKVKINSHIKISQKEIIIRNLCSYHQVNFILDQLIINNQE
jgi:hypothetical protein